MIGIDTNVLLRFFLPADNASQTSLAKDLIRRNAPIFINPITLVELVWVLQSKLRTETADVLLILKQIVQSSEFEFWSREATERAIAQFEKGKPDFADCMIGELNRSFGCATTMTFNVDAAKTAPFTRLQA